MSILSVEDYLASSHIYIEPRALKEVKIYIKLLRQEFKEPTYSVKEIRAISMQILAWLCYGARITECKFRLQRRYSSESMGYCCREDGRIVMNLGNHKYHNKPKMNSFMEYLDTLVHEWVHYYCYQVYGEIEFEPDESNEDYDKHHDKMFYKKVERLLKRIS
jgi:hypothetical protein